MKALGPQELNTINEVRVNNLIEKFNEKLQQEIVSSIEDRYFHVIIQGEYKRVDLDEVEKRFKEAGWTQVICRTSSENGERGGFTGLKLWNDK